MQLSKKWYSKPVAGFGLVGFVLGVVVPLSAQAEATRPNILVILTDDQGYGDLGVHGNPIIQTPVLDELARNSTRVEPFYVCPVCSPTRSSLLTGRYYYRTGVVDTSFGRSLMFPDEVTLAEMLRTAGYRTGIFGKWHLGDNYPLRPIDQGFDEAVVLKGGGLGQTSDFPDGGSYFNPILLENGQPKRFTGYCSDIFTQRAIEFIQRHQEQPFFVYLPFNCPHTPLEVPDEYYQRYQNIDFNRAFAEMNQTGQPVPKLNAKAQQEVARIYGMISNIDDNLGRLFELLRKTDLERQTYVLFFTDNGPQQARYTAGLRGRKASVYEGGIRVPLFIRGPGLAANKVVPGPASAIDLVPTILQWCQVAAPAPAARQLDGVSLVPLLQGELTQLPERTLFFQWHRGDWPEPFRACAVRTQRYKLVQSLGAGYQYDGQQQWELFDLLTDPYEQHDLSAKLPDQVAALKTAYEQWYADVTADRQRHYPAIVLGGPEQPMILTRQDWRGPNPGWDLNSFGTWKLANQTPQPYQFTVTFPKPLAAAGELTLTYGPVTVTQAVETGRAQATIPEVHLPVGTHQLEITLKQQNQVIGPQQVLVQPSQPATR